MFELLAVECNDSNIFFATLKGNVLKVFILSCLLSQTYFIFFFYISGGFVIGGILSPKTVTTERKARENVGKVNKIEDRKRICLDNMERSMNLLQK